jgi:hypothetical protein
MDTILLFITGFVIGHLVVRYFGMKRKLRLLELNTRHLDFFGKLHERESQMMRDAFARFDYEAGMRHYEACCILHKRAMDIPNPELLR